MQIAVIENYSTLYCNSLTPLLLEICSHLKTARPKSNQNLCVKQNSEFQNICIASFIEGIIHLYLLKNTRYKHVSCD